MKAVVWSTSTRSDVTFYLVEPDEPIARTYAKMPSLFQPLEAMPESIRAHLRVPETYFKILAQVLTIYHMQDPVVFYNREDAWSIPQEIYGERPTTMEPYYVITQLPGEERPEFILLMPFTPVRRDNMVGWLAARNDGEHYGEGILYLFPKERLTFGPMQIEARIDQDPYISELLTLWGQRGSRVIRGNLLAIPIENSLLYVEPIFLQAEQSDLPELTRVIVAHGDQVVMQPTLEMALAEIFGAEAVARAFPDIAADEIQPEEPSGAAGLGDLARRRRASTAGPRSGSGPATGRATARPSRSWAGSSSAWWTRWRKGRPGHRSLPATPETGCLSNGWIPVEPSRGLIVASRPGRRDILRRPGPYLWAGKEDGPWPQQPARSSARGRPCSWSCSSW